MRAAVPQRPDTITAHHPRIEIAGGPPGGLSMEGRIDVVRPAFEPLHPQAAPGKGPHERDARRGLALARTGRGDAEGVECRMSHRLFPFPNSYSIYFATYPRASYMAPASVIVRGPPMMTRVDISTSSAGKSSSLPIHLAS